jgi:hypothetical protein
MERIPPGTRCTSQLRWKYRLSRQAIRGLLQQLQLLASLHPHLELGI